MVLKNFHPGRVQDTFPTDLTAGLPRDHEKTTFRRFLVLERELDEVSHSLLWNNSEGNQYLLVEDLDLDTRYDLADARYAWGRRVLFKGYDALVRVPCYNAFRASKLVDLIIEECASGLGIQEAEMDWASGSGRPTQYTGDWYSRGSWRSWRKYWRKREMVVWTRTSTGQAEGKMPDDCFFPLENHNRAEDGKWPTLVVESGVFESLDRLREDAKWWFSRSYGDVRIVLVVVANKPRGLLRVEKWQLVPRDQVTLGPGLVPEMGQQTVDVQRPVLAQSVTVSPDAVVEGDSQIVLDFRAMFNRAPRGKETDVEIDARALMELVP